MRIEDHFADLLWRDRHLYRRLYYHDGRLFEICLYYDFAGFQSQHYPLLFDPARGLTTR